MQFIAIVVAALAFASPASAWVRGEVSGESNGGSNTEPPVDTSHKRLGRRSGGDGGGAFSGGTKTKPPFPSHTN